MARKHKLKSRPDVEPHVEEALLAQHMRDLGLSTIKEYQDWCSHQGLSPKLTKSARHRQQELARMRYTISEVHLKSRRRLHRDPLRVLLAICDGQLNANDVPVPLLQRLCSLLNQPGKQGESAVNRQALKRLLTHLDKVRCKLLEGSPSHLSTAGESSYIEAIARLAAHQSNWLRPPETWRPSSKNAWRQFMSLTRHLLVRYEMPAFFDAVWFDRRHHIAPRHRRWYLYVAQGGNIRKCTLPIAYTKRMAHHFMYAPHNLTVLQAIRWGQVLGLGGDLRLANTIVATRLGANFDHDSFWESVVRWLIANPMLDPALTHPIIDYLRYQRFEPVAIQVGDQLQRRPLQPRLSMKGRTADSLLRQMEAWHRQLSRSNGIQVQQWKAIGVADLCLNEGQAHTPSWRQWSIRELLSSSALVAEGRALRHCVASYASSCARGHTSIWTLERRAYGGQEKCVTIEVSPHGRTICQIRGRLNRLPTEQERRVIRHWAEQEGLRLAAYLG